MQAWLGIALLFGHAEYGFVSTLQIPGISWEAYHYHQPGDIDIGYMVGIYKYSPTKPCGGPPTSMQYISTLMYNIEQINKRTDLLPNITLGFVVVDDCGKDTTALARAYQLLGCSENVGANMTDVTVQKRPLVVGLIGPSNSRKSVMVGSLLSLFQIPVLGTYATSDELSDKARYGYFLRLVPPDRFQAEALGHILERYKWSYVQLLYGEGSYGENGAKQAIKQLKNRGICVAYHQMLTDFTDYDKVASKLLKYKNARVVILILGSRVREIFFEAMTSKNTSKMFIWLGFDSFAGVVSTKYQEIAKGLFYITYNMVVDESFKPYHLSLTPSNSQLNPWFKPFWENRFHCSFGGSRNTTPCDPHGNISHSENFAWSEWTCKVTDGILTYAHALHALISHHCPNISGNKKYIRRCVTGRRLLHHLKQVDIQGLTGKIQFDDKGDMISGYKIYQFAYDNATGARKVELGYWDKRTDNLEIDDNKIDWSYFEKSDPEGDSKSNTPESICSRPCRRKEYYIPQELPCCWLCRACRNNEIIVNNRTNCAVCPLFSWPDEETATICLPILVEYIRWDEPVAIVMAVIALIGLIACSAVSIGYVKYRTTKLIKASSRELSALILGGVASAFATVFLIVATPTDIICVISRLLFSLSCTMIYGPLCIKTVRIYRIFAAGKRGKKRPGLTSSSAQIVMSLMIVCTQVVILVGSAIVAVPQAKLRMQVPTQPRVELLCDVPVDGMAAPLAFNTLLVIVCAIFGFMTRKLPQNFNESWYIFVSVSTTLFLWVVFLPTYFTSFFAYQQVVLLAACLLLIGTITLLCLYLPKLYAVVFVDEKNLMFVTLTASATAEEEGPPSSTTSCRRNKVGPTTEAM